MTSLAQLTLLIGALAAYSLAKHVTCSWRPGSGLPKAYGFAHYCTGSISDLDPKKGTKAYLCRDQSNKTFTVGTWNVVGANALNFASPCGPNGWFQGFHGPCDSDAFAMCLGANNPGDASDCFYMAPQDDCQWPTPFYGNSLPPTVDMWYKLQ